MKIAIIGKPGYIEETYLKSTEQIFKEVGLNTGNLVFWHAVSTHIIDEKDYFGWDFSPDYINKNYDRLIFIGANQLNPETSMGFMAEKFSKITIPLIVLGIGAQAELGADTCRMQTGTVDFMRIISKKCKTISVRGEFTKKVFETYGINNVEVTGCPSNFINLKQDVGKLSNPKQLAGTHISSAVMNVDIIPKMQDFIPLAINWSHDMEQCIFVSQAPLNILELTRDREFSSKQEALKIVRGLMMPGSSLRTVAKFINNNFKAFYNTASWLEELLMFSLSIGTRMHGNMLAFQAGVPTVFIAHDARVLEMFQTMKLPYITLEEVMEYKNINNIINNVAYCPHEYKKNRIELAKKYVSILQENNISISKNLLRLINSDNEA